MSPLVWLDDVSMTSPASLNDADLEIGHPRFRVLGHALHRAWLGEQFLAALAALRPKGTLDLGRPSKNFSRPKYLI
jgi:hypothetical protein